MIVLMIVEITVMKNDAVVRECISTCIHVNVVCMLLAHFLLCSTET